MLDHLALRDERVGVWVFVCARAREREDSVEDEMTEYRQFLVPLRTSPKTSQSVTQS